MHWVWGRSFRFSLLLIEQQKTESEDKCDYQYWADLISGTPQGSVLASADPYGISLIISV